MAAMTSIIERLVQPQAGGFSAEHARYVLSLDLSNQEKARYAALAEKVQSGQLSTAEQAELDSFLGVNALLTILQSKARVSLRRANAVEATI